MHVCGSLVSVEVAVEPHPVAQAFPPSFRLLPTLGRGGWVSVPLGSVAPSAGPPSLVSLAPHSVLAPQAAAHTVWVAPVGESGMDSPTAGRMELEAGLPGLDLGIYRDGKTQGQGAAPLVPASLLAL